jgi:outer membrane immunogenic protein
MKRGSWIGAAAVVAAVLGLSGAAQADDYSWNGIYIGAEGGGASGHSTSGYVNHTNGSGTTVIDSAVAIDGPELSFSNGFVGGHVGLMHQFGGLVLGIDGSYDWTNLNDTQISGQAVPGPSLAHIATDTREVDIKSVGAINGRLGVAHDRWLAYATGGIAFGSLSANEKGLPPLNNPYLNAADFNRIGWDAGAGVAYAVTNSLIVGAEYKHYDFGTSDQQLAFTCTNCAGYETVRVHPELDTIEARLTYKFDIGDRAPAPLK